MAAAPDPAAPPPPPDTLHRALESYPWHTDREFQSGLQAILGPSSSPASSDQTQTSDLTLRARCFYYARKYSAPVDFDAYKAWREQQPPSSLSPLEPVSLPPPSSAESSAENTPSKLSAAGGVNGAAASGGPAGEPSTQQPQQQQNIDGGDPQDQDTQPAYPPSFATIMELIKSGQPIPGIKEIPDTVLEDQATEATKTRRKKPWEERQGAAETDVASAAGAYGGYFGPPASGGEAASSSLFSGAQIDS